ncbi:hypothetical protein EGW08_000999 [Elysia chlorotica]|uniref:Endonuclease/exonuclease/phosphatase domain-containing protein n=1 Tax=Elysia chlorotica TaxID=188477 RepID=A0A3S1I2W9_ELYCH|nr:hypothetical protein EGW08_000999 [Elysia chlorotica]
MVPGVKGHPSQTTQTVAVIQAVYLMTQSRCRERDATRKSGRNSAPSFHDEFSDYLDSLNSEANVYIVGDFNFHYENKNISSVSTFHSLIEEHGLTQHVEQPTHKHQHILDLVMSRCETNHLFGLKVNDICLSDHYIISFGVNIDKPPLIKKCFFTRDIKSIDINKFKETVSSILSTNNPRTVEKFNIILRDVLDQFAPLCERRISARPFAPWFTPRVQTAKQLQHVCYKTDSTLQNRNADSVVEHMNVDVGRLVRKGSNPTVSAVSEIQSTGFEKFQP